jgi:hypothetical protein
MINISNKVAIKHLESFIKSFIKNQYKDRWIYFIFKKKSNVSIELKKFENHYDNRFSKIINKNDNKYDDLKGLYYNGGPEIKLLYFDEAMQLNTNNSEDAIFSVKPGELAFFFFHEGWMWKCQRNLKP